MLSPKFSRPAALVVGAGSALSVFGMAAPAQAAVDCSTGVTVDAIEQDIRDAINAGETLICINPGTVDLGTTGADGVADQIEINDADLTLVSLGEVVFDGGSDAPNAFVLFGESDENLTVDGFTFRNFNNLNDNPFGVVGLDGSSGTITVLNSTFFGNTGYASVSATNTNDSTATNIVVDNSLFLNNDVFIANVWGKADVTVTNSSFVGNLAGTNVSADGSETESHTEIHGNYFDDNEVESGAVAVASDTSVIYNNTFANTFASGGSFAEAILYGENQTAILGFNTFIGNDADGPSADIIGQSNTEVHLVGNIWVNDNGYALGVAESATNVSFVDEGGNFSTGDDAQYLDHESSSNEVAEADLDISDPADNGGVTYTAAIGSDSIAIDAVPAATASEVLGIEFLQDQRGLYRVDDRDAGAYEYGATEEQQLAATGVEPLGIALTGGVLGAAGAALVLRRRRKA